MATNRDAPVAQRLASTNHVWATSTIVLHLALDNVNTTSYMRMCDVRRQQGSVLLPQWLEVRQNSGNVL